MTEKPQKINVMIGGIYYQLVSTEDDQYTRQIASRADEMIRRVMQDNPHLTQNMASILAFVNAIDELNRARRQVTVLEDQHQADDNRMAELRAELVKLRGQNWDMKKEILLQNEMKQTSLEDIINET